MKKIAVIVTILTSVVLLLSACGIQQKVENKATQKPRSLPKTECVRLPPKQRSVFLFQPAWQEMPGSSAVR